MQIRALLPLLALGAASVHGRPEPKPFLGHRELAVPDSFELHPVHGPTHRQSFNYIDPATGNFTKLEYGVVHTTDVFVLRLDLPAEDPLQTAEAMAVDAIECSAGGNVAVRFAEPGTAAAKKLEELLVPGSLVAAGRHWGCLDEKSGNPTVVLVRVTAPAHVDEKTGALQLSTEPAHYNNFFKHANITFHSTRLPYVEVPEPEDAIADADEAPAPAVAEQRLRTRRGLWDFCESAWEDVKSIGSAVESVVDTVSKVAKVLTGDLDFSKSTTLASTSWNFESDKSGHWSPAGSKDIAIDGSYTCDHCFFTADLALKFDLNVQSYGVKLAQVILDGEADARVGFTGTVRASVKKGASKKITTLHYAPAPFLVGGIPVAIDMTMPITAGYTLQGEMKGKLNLAGEAHGGVRFGFSYQDGKFGLISDHKLSHHGLLYEAPGDITASLKMYVNPVMVVQVDYMGGPTIGIQAWIEFQGRYGNAASCAQSGDCDCGPGGMQIATSAGATGTIGGQIDVGYQGHSLYKKSFPSKGIFNVKKEIAAGCLMDHAPPSPSPPSGGGPAPPSAQKTEQGCTCQDSWSVGGCDGTVYHGCGMVDPCDGDYSHASQGYPTWCFTEGSCGLGDTGAQGLLGCNSEGYVQQTVGTCDAGTSFIDTSEECASAAKSLGLSETSPRGASVTTNPYGCYVRSGRLYFNPSGDRNDGDTDRVSLCSCSAGGAAKWDYCSPDSRRTRRVAAPRAAVATPTPLTKATVAPHTKENWTALLKRMHETRFNGALLGGGPPLSNNGLVAGTVWTGTLTPVPGASSKCATKANTGASTTGNFSMQIVENTAGAVISLIGAAVWTTASAPTAGELQRDGAELSAAVPLGDSCIIQSGFTFSYYEGSNDLIIKPADTSADYSACANGQPDLPYGWYGQTNFDLTMITAQDSLGCSKIQLWRGDGPAAPPPGPPPPPSDCQDLSEGAFNRAGSCLGTPGCGWCIDHDYNSACCNDDGRGNAAFPCTSKWGELLECSKGWQDHPVQASDGTDAE